MFLVGQKQTNLAVAMFVKVYERRAEQFTFVLQHKKIIYVKLLDQDALDYSIAIKQNVLVRVR